MYKELEAPVNAMPTPSLPPGCTEEPATPLARHMGQWGRPDVSVILPVHNADRWLDKCLKSVLEQDFQGTLELSVFNDASTDTSLNIIEKWQLRLEERGIPVVLGSHDSAKPCGVGFAKNQAVKQSSGRYLCFLDSDDVMMPQRVKMQFEAAIQHPQSIIGCQIRREPAGSTERYTRWINGLTPEQLLTQVTLRSPTTSSLSGPHLFLHLVFTSHGPTVIMPTWFCAQEWFCHVGKFDEGGTGVPEDLLFFYDHLQKGGGVVRVDQCLLQYRYHPDAATLSVLEGTIWDHRVKFLEDRVLAHWTWFTIWNAGKQGRKLYRSLSQVNQKKVVAFCDVAESKLAKGFYTFEESKERPKPKIPIQHYKDANPPFIICVKLDLTGGDFEDNLNSLNLKEGVDYFHFN